METKKSLGRRIAQLRKERGLTIEKLAYESDVSKSHLADLEKGKWNASISVLGRLADRLELPIWSLLVFPETSEVDSQADALARGRTAPKKGRSRP